MIDKKLKTPEQIVRDSQLYATRCRQTFSTNSGRLVIQQLKKVYCDGNLFGQDDRSTVYMIGQRDLVLELASHIDELGEDTDEGTDI